MNIFNLKYPKKINGLDSSQLNPMNNWEQKNKYDILRNKLAEMFISNFKKYKECIDLQKTVLS